MKLLNLRKKVSQKKGSTPSSTASFSRLTKEQQKVLITKGAKDFAVRFEGVMRELSNG
jgi:hypothetical protein